jgi:heme oxygenase
MSKIKELTWEHHKNAERQEFAKLLISGNIHPDIYATYLWNQHKKYDLLEAMASMNGLFNDIGDIRRKLKMEEDIAELWKHEYPPTIVPSTEEYIEHMRTIMQDRNALLAHVYVLYMGDLSGGQMIKRTIPGEGRMYDFSEVGDVKEVKEKIRALITDDMADEAKWVFESSTKLFQELMELDIEHTVESSDTVSE